MDSPSVPSSFSGSKHAKKEDDDHTHKAASREKEVEKGKEKEMRGFERDRTTSHLDDHHHDEGEREGIGGWILEEGRQENVTLVREKRAGFGGWISDSAENSKEESGQCSFQRDDATKSDIQTLQTSEGTFDKQASSVASTLRRRRSRWEPQPLEAREGQEASESSEKRRKSCWSAEESKPLVQLPDFVKDLTSGISKYQKFLIWMQNFGLDLDVDSASNPAVVQMLEKLGWIWNVGNVGVGLDFDMAWTLDKSLAGLDAVTDVDVAIVGVVLEY
ncbi:hypothetical protein L7F22_050846 [Adiantum nelumboides]|nr:hypothetical protein [Adiantum nelumboides]